MPQILVVDDDDVVAFSVQNALREYEVLHATDGVEGLDLFRLHMADIRLVVLDIQMPHLDGRATCLKIRSMNQNIPIVPFTGFPREDTLNMLRELGCFSPIIKPADLNVIARTLRAALASVPPPPAPAAALLTYAQELVTAQEQQGRAERARPAIEVAAPTISPRIEVRAFGPGQVQRNGVLLSAADWGGSAIGRELFFYALECAPQSKDQIGVMFWPDLSPERMTSAFHAAKYRIQRALGIEFLNYDVESYRINPAADIWYDVAEFDCLLDAARDREPEDADRLTEIERAAALYTGDYLCSLYSNWVVEKRQLLQIRFFAALQRLINDLIGRREFERALEHSLRGLDHDYYREDLHRAVMRCLSGTGHPADALAHYAAASQRLTVELGTPLEQATIDLADRIRASLAH